MSLLQCPEFPQAIPQKGGPPVTIQSLHLAEKNALLRVIPTMAFQGIYSDIWANILSDILSDIYSDILSGILSDIYSDILSGILSDVLFSWGTGQEGEKREVEGRGEVAVRVRRGTLRSSACSWGPAGNTLILSLLFGSGGEHCEEHSDPELAVRVRPGNTAI